MAQQDSSPLLIPFTALGVLLAIGLIVGGLLLGTRIRDFKRANRYVEVKGLVERTVKSDSASWPISFSEAGDNLAEVYAASEKNKAAVLAFLQAQGFSQNDLTLGSLAVTDRSTEQFDNNSHAPRFVVRQTITLQSSNVDKVAAANAKTGDLIRAGVVIQSGGPGQASGVIYKFSSLNALKPKAMQPGGPQQ